uniref:Uncharacterized protein LOC114326252 n=1 Tax=Diabrotica virgifera virgifera TaxID=50390 RepID=A0A6P7F9T0_DIAVI
MTTSLWVKGNIATQILTKQKLEKYGHLLKWKNNERILEFGAADGNTSVNSILPFLPKDYKEYVLTDISPNMVEHMKKNLNIPRSKIIQHDISTVRLQDELKNKFDHIFGIFVLHMVPNTSLIESLKDILKMAMVLPQQYNESNDMTTVSTLKHFEKYKDLIKWKADECILEFSIGDGKCSANCLQPILPEDYKEFVVLDISKQLIDFVQTKIGIPRVQFVVEDIANKSMPSEFENRFDHIFEIFAMHNVHNPNQAFKNIYKMLKPGGQVFINIII